VTPDLVDVDAEVLQQGLDERVLLLEERQQQMVRVDLRVPARGSKLLRSLDGLLRLDRELIEPHI
jgi:hypothetical protein